MIGFALDPKAGCKAQVAHTDYPPVPLISNEHVPVNVLVALQDDTFLNVRPKSHKVIAMEPAGEKEKEYVEKDQIHMKIIKMNEGLLLITTN